MTSRERLLAVLRGQLPDRVPISTYEINGWNAQGFENTQPSYQRLMELIRRNTDCLYPTCVGVPNLRHDEVETKVENWDEGDQHMARYTTHVGGRTLTTVQSHSDDVMTTWTREHTCKSVEDLAAYVSRPWSPGEPDFSNLERAYKELDGVHGIPMLDMGDPLCEVAHVQHGGLGCLRHHRDRRLR
jgi:hypothetical protein